MARNYAKRPARATRPSQRPAAAQRAAKPRQAPRPAQAKPPQMPGREWMRRNEQRNAAPVPQPTSAMQDYARQMGTRGVYPGAMAPNQQAASYTDWARQYGANALNPGTIGGGGRTVKPRYSPTLLPDTYAAQQNRNRGMPTTPTSMPDALMNAVNRRVGTGSGIPRPTYLRPGGEGYAEPPGAGYGEGGGAGGYDWGDWGDGGGGGGYTPSSYPGYTGNAYADNQGGYNPMRAQTPRWWHNRLTWRF